uniref:DDE Tnp4 domain-containing protein n=1 Tax=Trichogramma kaykai TaxID=54128 RepID=A0ABD2VV58_9HYME
MELIHQNLNQLNMIWNLYCNWLRNAEENQEVLRRWWAKPHIKFNYLHGYGAFRTVYHYYKMHDEEEFYSFCRLTIRQFNCLYEMVAPNLLKHICLHFDLSMLMLLDILIYSYLAAADSVNKNSAFYNLGKSTLYAVIPEVCSVISSVVGPKFLRTPSTEDFRRIAQEYEEQLHFPHCIGAIDAKHFEIKKPEHSGSLFFNYKNFFNISLMAVCDVHRRFTMVNLGDYGSANDAGNFANGDIGSSLENGEIRLPMPEPLQNSNAVCPFYLIGDGGFPLKSYLMKPYLRTNNMSIPQKIFNYRLSHARQVIECAFGELSKTWEVNMKKLEWKLSNCELIILATLCLHNYKITMDLREKRGYKYHWIDAPEEFVENEQHNAIAPPINVNEIHLRQELSQYLISPAGSVPWQWTKI